MKVLPKIENQTFLFLKDILSSHHLHSILHKLLQAFIIHFLLHPISNHIIQAYPDQKDIIIVTHLAMPELGSALASVFTCVASQYVMLCARPPHHFILLLQDFRKVVCNEMSNQLQLEPPHHLGSPLGSSMSDVMGLGQIKD